MTRSTICAASFLVTACLLQAGAHTASQSGTKDDPKSSCPMHEQHMRERAARQGHHDEVNARGDKEMGFSHVKTTHHFLLAADGGSIDVAANDASDTQSREEIRTHLRAIAKSFSDGDFKTPMAVHGRIPPGVPAMERHKSAIVYTYEQTARGARVRITTNNPDALDAIHDFLRFQIEDHQTGDPLDVSTRR